MKTVLKNHIAAEKLRRQRERDALRRENTLAVSRAHEYGYSAGILKGRKEVPLPPGDVTDWILEASVLFQQIYWAPLQVRTVPDDFRFTYKAPVLRVRVNIPALCFQDVLPETDEQGRAPPFPVRKGARAMTAMICGRCGQHGIHWRDLTTNPWTECPHCGGRNCQEEPEPEDEESEE